eukprot:435141-Rhodomonas_salina.2
MLAASLVPPALTSRHTPASQYRTCRTVRHQDRTCTSYACSVLKNPLPLGQKLRATHGAAQHIFPGSDKKRTSGEDNFDSKKRNEAKV